MELILIYSGDEKLNTNCYLILAHNDPIHLGRLVDRLDYCSDFFIHIDAKSDIQKFKIPSLARKNVFFIEKRYPIHWGGYNMVQATLELIKVSMNTGEYQRFTLLSGNDYPLRNAKSIYNFFEENSEIDFIKGINLDALSKTTYESFFHRALDYKLNYDFELFRYSKLNLLCRNIRNHTFGYLKNHRQKSSEYLPIYSGSQWWSITRNTLLMMLDLSKKYSKYMDSFHSIFVPDEKYFHTLYFNLGLGIENNPIDIKTFEDRSKQTSLLANLHVIHPSLKKVYVIQDFEFLKAASSKFIFVRKVNSMDSEELLDLIDTELLNEK